MYVSYLGCFLFSFIFLIYLQLIHLFLRDHVMYPKLFSILNINYEIQGDNNLRAIGTNHI
jgi:hypothetical protein